MANAVDSDHAPLPDKAETLAGYFALYPPVARKQLTTEFRLVLGVLSELEPLVLGNAIVRSFKSDGDQDSAA